MYARRNNYAHESGIYRDKRTHEADLDMVNQSVHNRIHANVVSVSAYQPGHQCDQVLQRAWDAGIGALICTGV